MTSYDMDAVLKFTQPLPRQGVVDDVADAAVFLASERSAQITGIVLPVDGGTTAGPPANQLKLMLGASRESGNDDQGSGSSAGSVTRFRGPSASASPAVTSSSAWRATLRGMFLHGCGADL